MNIYNRDNPLPGYELRRLEAMKMAMENNLKEQP